MNFVTRSSYDGLQVSAQAGTCKGYNTYGASLLWGTSVQQRLDRVRRQLGAAGGIKYDTSSRPYLNPNYIAQGGTNNLSFNCDPATI